MCYVSQAHTHTHTARARQDIGTPTPTHHLSVRPSLHFTSLRSDSVQFTPSFPKPWRAAGGLAPGITRIHKRRQAMTSWHPPKKKSPLTVAVHVLLSVRLSNHKRAALADKDMDAALPQLPPSPFRGRSHLPPIAMADI